MRPPFEVYVNGVRQERGDGLRGRDGALVFERELKKEGKLGFWRWFLGAWGVGTYRQNDSVDVRYERDGRPDAARGPGHRAGGDARRGARRAGRGAAAAARACALRASVLADSSVVTLALPAILRDFDATVNGVAWVLIAFNLALALAALRGRAAGARAGRGARSRLASCCSWPPAWRARGAVAGGADRGARRRRACPARSAWRPRSSCSCRRRGASARSRCGRRRACSAPRSARRPAGFLTEWLSWEAMFALQAPLGARRRCWAAGGRRSLRGRRRAPSRSSARRSRRSSRWRSPRAALSAALFLLVDPAHRGLAPLAGEAALTVTVDAARGARSPAAGRAARHGLVPAVAGALLVAGGLAALGLLPGAHAWLDARAAGGDRRRPRARAARR